MKVALITGSYPHHPCGVGDYTERLSRKLVTQEVDVYVVTMDRPEIKCVDDHGVMVYKAVTSWGLLDVIPLLKSIKAAQPDVIHIQYPSRGYQWSMLPVVLPALLWLAFPSAARVVTIHEFTIANALRKIAIFFLLLLANKIILTDRNERQAVLKWLPWLKDRCAVIRIGANIEPVSHQEKAPRSVKGPYIAYFGFINQSKDTLTLLKAFQQLRSWKVKCKLLMITQASRQDRDVIKDLGLAGAVIITGYCSPGQVSHFLSQATLCALPFTDGISFRRGTFLAALQHGLPVATTQGKYIPKGLKNWHNVVMTPVGDSQLMAKAMLKLLENPDLRRKISRNARTFGMHFEWETISRLHKTLYRSLMTRKSGRAANEASGPLRNPAIGVRGQTSHAVP